jgi:hypothetical protein
MTRENRTLYNIYYIIYNVIKNKIQKNSLLTLCDTILSCGEKEISPGVRGNKRGKYRLNSLPL